MKPAEPHDPMELVGVVLPGSGMENMAACLVEEYLMLGFSDQQILALFRRPCFGATHGIYRARGEDYVRALICDVRRRYTETYRAGSDAHE
ncbi:MAG: hypothetical protein IT496_04890 [Gammaproteobacteria bacterium]|nr:hypothetical protein [Gammaproteobacteria bacterium]